MKRAILFLLFVSLAACGAGRRPTEQPREPVVRPAAVAGGFYPGHPAELTQLVDSLLAEAKPPALTEPLVALISPHAGYPYSGPVAAYAYALLKGRQYDRVVVLAPSHVDAFSFASVYSGDGYATPLGVVPVDREFCKKLANGSTIRLSQLGHVSSSGQGEHALEVQLPFLQRTLGTFKLVPIIMGDQSYETCRAVGVALAKLAAGTNTLIVASSDLSHFHGYQDAVRIDHKTLRAIEEWDYLSMSNNFEQRVWEACGGAPIVAAMIASERLGANQARLLRYANSGDVTNDRLRVVGYGALALVKGAPGSAAEKFSLSPADKAELLALARKSVESAVRDHKRVEYTPSGALAQERGAFVTLTKKGNLRGCIGYITPTKPLGITVRDVAAAAALEDRRFRPVTVEELKDLDYEVSVLSPLRRIYDVKQIEIGRDGIIMKKGYSLGLFLPQVPVEQKWGLDEYLREACLKAGLPQDAWKDPETDIFTFTALVFGK